MMPQNKYKAIMIVGTSSNCGKSFLATALCRYFKNKKISVAPYKAQNMSLNSFVTDKGREMAHAQVIQAQAADIKPHTDMNPVLIKPQGNFSSQLIINGKYISNITTENYKNYIKLARAAARSAYDRLAKKYDLIIMEGAGSPTEINILQYDFVNMSAAEYAKAKVLLVADIDRGGSFASIYGTVKLLPKKYQKLFSGIIINKFIGNINILKNGIKKIEKLLNIPVLGVIPFLKNIQLDAEDTLSLNYKSHSLKNNDLYSHKKVNVSIIKLPHMSNSADFSILKNHKNVNCNYVDTKKNLNGSDLIIIPGTKSTCTDMQYLINSGLAEKIKSLNKKKKTPIFGICGGYQILGETISDPHQLEGDISHINGLGLLPVKTVISKKKKLNQIEGLITKDFPFSFIRMEISIKGYEIHNGRTTGKAFEAPIKVKKYNGRKCNKKDGYIDKTKNIFGTYIHGLFDCVIFTENVINYFAKKKKIKITNCLEYNKKEIYDYLADIFNKHIKDPINIHTLS